MIPLIFICDYLSKTHYCDDDLDKLTFCNNVDEIDSEVVTFIHEHMSKYGNFESLHEFIEFMHGEPYYDDIYFKVFYAVDNEWYEHKISYEKLKWLESRFLK